MSRNLHPMSLCLIVSVHGRGLEAYKSQQSVCALGWRRLPEYPHSPVHHLNKPTVIKMTGRMTHCEVALLAGQKKDASGKAGT